MFFPKQVDCSRYTVTAHHPQTSWKDLCTEVVGDSYRELHSSVTLCTHPARHGFQIGPDGFLLCIGMAHSKVGTQFSEMVVDGEELVRPMCPVVTCNEKGDPDAERSGMYQGC